MRRDARHDREAAEEPELCEEGDAHGPLTWLDEVRVTKRQVRHVRFGSTRSAAERHRRSSQAPSGVPTGGAGEMPEGCCECPATA